MIGDLLDTIFMRGGRSLGGIIPQVAIEEVHRDEVAITDHPIEQGASISDHAYKMPAEVIVRYGWSNSRDLIDIVRTGGLADPDEVYRQLLDLQESRQPFDVITRRRSYRNMLIRSLQVTTDRATNGILMVSAALRQALIVQVTGVQVPPKVAQAFPVDTAPPTNAGVKQAKPVNESILYKGGSISGAIFR